jgi:hypothetical protein
MRLLLLLFSLFTTALHAEGFTRAELQKFIDDALTAGGGQVILPPGTHTLDAPLVIKNATKLRVVGLDAEDTLLQPVQGTAKGFPLIQIEGTATELHIVKITFTTAATGDDFARVPLIEVQGSTEKDDDKTTRLSISIDRCFFQNHSGPGITLSGAKDSHITACTFMDLGGPAIQAEGKTTALTLRHNHITRTASPTITFGAETRDGQIIANELQSGTLKIEGQNHQLQANLLPDVATKK